MMKSNILSFSFGLVIAFLVFFLFYCFNNDAPFKNWFFSSKKENNKHFNVDNAKRKKKQISNSEMDVRESSLCGDDKHMSSEADLIEKDSIGRIEEGVLKSIALSEEMKSKANDARDIIERASSEFEKSGGGEEAEAKFIRTLAGLDSTVFLTAVHDMMRTGTAKTRIMALTAISAIYGDPSSTQAVSMIGGDGVGESTIADERSLAAGSLAPSKKNEESNSKRELIDELNAKAAVIQNDESALRIRMLVESVSAGLADGVTDVKDTAYETMLTLPEESLGILASQVLSGGDAELKQRLLTAVRNPIDSISLKINIQALASEDGAARLQAASNLKDAFGQNFSSSEEAAQWIAENVNGGADGQKGSDSLHNANQQ